jgi:hypothetical protein
MDENLIPQGQRTGPVRRFWSSERLEAVVPDLFWFVLFPACLFAYRATVPLAAVYLLILILLRGGRYSLQACRNTLATIPLTVWLCIGVAVVSLGWTADQAGAAKVLGAEVMSVAVLAFALLALVGSETGRLSPYWLAASLILTSLLLMVELRTGMMLHGALGLLQKAPRLNQSVMIVTLAVFPVLYMLKAQRGLAVLHKPWFGYGFNGSFTMLGDPNFSASEGELRYGFMQGHPHNLFLQVFVETGLLGCVLILALLWLLLGTIARLEHGLRSVAGAFLIYNLTVLAVSHGAWQAWWWAADLLAVLLLVGQARLVMDKGNQG